ncbi:hypothetical protein NPIL_31651 [Nephila pilipes]|uniref:Uncharacterized protein n=1 Tax=Nephila pilipes TaxID=299642 RepID=A0A8X6QHS2_NEPPI|nr:hypothetical protein NPIL_31651 [Nephila pilipes]
MFPKLHKKVHKFGEIGASVIKHDRTKSLFFFHCVRECNRMTLLAAESSFIGRRDAVVASDWSIPLIRIPSMEACMHSEQKWGPWHLTNVEGFFPPVSGNVPSMSVCVIQP